MSVSQKDFDHKEALELDRIATSQVRDAQNVFGRKISYQESVDRIVATKVAELSNPMLDEIENVRKDPESFGSKMTRLRSIIERGNEAVSNDEGYAHVKYRVDAAYAVLRTIDPNPLSVEEKAVFDEIGEAHNDLSMELAMMDEPTE